MTDKVSKGRHRIVNRALTDDQVIEIRELLQGIEGPGYREAREVTLQEIAERFDVSVVTIQNIRYGKLYQQVA